MPVRFRLRSTGFALATLAAGACGGDRAVAPLALTPVLRLSADSIALVPAQTALLTATVRDAAGAELRDRVVTWTTSDSLVALVRPTGEIVARAPGQATVTAAAGSLTAAARVVVSASVGLFRAPFGGQVSTSNLFDHDVPFQFQPAYDNGYLLSFWGERVSGIDGHNGYDFTVSTGTPLLAVGDGVVTFAGEERPFFCPLLQRTTAGLWLTVEHRTAPGLVLRTQYGHLSRIDARVGDSVRAGQTLGLSGNTGCSTGPHLHFAMFRLTPDGRFVVIDPFGWGGAVSDDVWAAHVSGLPGVALWRPEGAPALYTEFSYGVDARADVSPTRVRWMGVRDDAAPNNEFVDVTLNRSRATAVDLGRYVLQNNAGDTFAFPAGHQLTTASPTVRVYSGAGTNTPTALYWGRARGAWHNMGDCVRLVDTVTRVTSFAFVRTSRCGAVNVTTAATRLPLAGDGRAAAYAGRGVSVP